MIPTREQITEVLNTYLGHNPHQVEKATDEIMALFDDENYDDVMDSISAKLNDEENAIKKKYSKKVKP